jgi:transcriptional regulator with XRE-family HTH domain
MSAHSANAPAKAPFSPPLQGAFGPVRRVRISYTAMTMAKKPFSVEQEVRHYGVVLRQIIRAAGLTVTEVERRLGQGPKSLRRVFCGEVDLKVKHIVSVLHVLGMPEEKFFEIVAERRKKRRAAADELLEAFEAMGYRGDLVADEDDPPPPGGFDRLVEETVRRVVDRLQLELQARRDQDNGKLDVDTPVPLEE